MEEGVKRISCVKSTHLSLQIIISILTIIKLFIDFHEIEFNIFTIIDIVINFIMLITVIMSSFFVDHCCFFCILGQCWFASLVFGVLLTSFFVSYELLGIYNFALFARMLLFFPFFVVSGLIHH